MVPSLRKGIYFILLLGMSIPLLACQPLGNSDDDEGDKTEQEEKDHEGKDHDEKENENKSEKDN
jgi:hypothetical protein